MVVLSALVAGCGRPICFGPIGNLADCYPRSSSNTTGSTTAFHIEVPTANQGLPITRGASIVLTARNGIGPYHWQIISTGTTGTLSISGQTGPIFTGNTVTYTAPSAAATTTIQLSDSAGTVQSTQLALVTM